MEPNTDYEVIEKRARNRKRLSQTILYILLTIWAVLVCFPYPKVFYPVTYAEELCGCLYQCAAWQISAQYADLYSDHDSADAGGYYAGGLRLCQTGV